MKSYNVNYSKKKKTTGDMEIDVFSRVVMLNYIGMSLWLLFTGFDFLVDNLVLKIQKETLPKFLENIYLKRDKSTLLNIYLFGP